MQLLRTFWFVYQLWIIHLQQVSSSPQQWGENCPSECQCEVFDISQTMLSRWKKENERVKTAMCVLQHSSLDKMLQLPTDTDLFTFLQGMDNVNITLDAKVMDVIVNIRSMDIQGYPTKANLFLTNNVFRNMSSLLLLSLQHVDLQKAEKAFANLKSLEVLQVTNCNILFLKWEMLEGLSMLKELYLMQSRIKELYDFAFYGTPELRRLFLSHNDLFSVDADNLVGLLKLEHLDLSNNKIDHLSGLTFPPMPRLQWLELKHNPIKVIFPHCFQFLNGTQHLTLGHKLQPVHLMKFSFRGLFSLIFLHIPNIDNDALNEHMFYDLKSLLHLHLQGRVKIINARAFNGAHKVLQKLILHNCQLEKVMEDAFHGLEKLITLDLSSNYLTYLREDIFEPLQSIKELLLSNNLFKSLPSEIFHELKTLKSLRLDANPWNCTCQMSSWDEEIAAKMPKVIQRLCSDKTKCQDFATSYVEDNRLSPKCEYPVEHQGRNMFEVLEVHLNCDDEELI